jgi:hypothetical protein
MSRTKNTLAQTLKKWDTLNTAIKPLLADLPAAAKDQTDFEASIVQVKALSLTQDSLTGQVRDTIKSRLAEEQSAKSLYDRLASHLRAKFGPKSDLLLEFAVKPRRTGRKKKAVVTPAPQPEATTRAPASKAAKP